MNISSPDIAIMKTLIILFACAIASGMAAAEKGVQMATQQFRSSTTQTAIFDAAWKGDLNTVMVLLPQHADLEAADPRNGATLLMAAASSGSNELVKFLVSKGANVKAKGGSGETALHYAAWNGNFEMTRLLIDSGADVNAVYRANGGLTPLSCAAESGDMETIQYLVAHGAKVYFPGIEKAIASPLRSAAFKGHFEAFRYFAGKMPAEYDWQEALFYAIIGGNPEMVRYVVEQKGARVGVRSKIWNVLPIQKAAENGLARNPEDSVKIIDYLVSRGAKLQDINRGKIFPWAMEKSNEKTIAYFLSKGFKYDALQNGNGWPPLADALDNSSFVLAQSLVGTDKNPMFGGLPLIVFFSDGLGNSPAIMDFLIKNGINKKHHDAAFLQSAGNNDLESVKLLLAAGANINAKDPDGFSALRYVTREDLAAFLIEKGIDTKNEKLLAGAYRNFPLLCALKKSNIDAPVTRAQADEGLWKAAQLGNVCAVKYFLSKGANVNARPAVISFSNGQDENKDKIPALFANADQGYERANYDEDNSVSDETAKILIQAGADMDLKDAAGKTALHHACGSQWSKVWIDPIPIGTRQDRQRGFHGDPAVPPLQNHDAIVRALVKGGAKINEPDKNGDTPLISAVQNKNYGAVKILLDAGANIAVKNKNGESALYFTSDDRMIAVMKQAGISIEIPQESLNNSLTEFMKKFHYGDRYDGKELGRLVAAGADINLPLYGKSNALLFFLDNDSKKITPAIAKDLIDLGINLSAKDENGRTALILAVEKKAADGVIERLIQSGADVNAAYFSRITALTAAKVLENKSAATILIKNGARRDVTAEWWYGLYELWRLDDMEKFKELIKAGADINARANFDIYPVSSDGITGNGMTALMYFSKKWPWMTNWSSKMQTFIDLGADVNIADNDGRTALHHAAMQENAANAQDSRQLLSIFKKAGANFSIKDKDGKTAFDHAADTQPHLADLMLESIPSVDRKKATERSFIYAAREQSLANLKKLMETGRIDVNAALPDGKTALIHAALFGRADTVGELIKLGANVNAADKNGSTALMFASYSGYLQDYTEITKEDAAEYMRLYNADIFNSGEYLKSANFMARHYLEIVKLLMKAGAEMEAKDSNGLTPLMYAASRAYVTSIAKYLIERGAAINASSANGDTPLMLAVRSGNHETIKMLLAAGAGTTMKNKDGMTASDFSSDDETTAILKQTGASRKSRAK
jgi:ankyrin repeat protein